jgi:hypothetical protein
MVSFLRGLLLGMTSAFSFPVALLYRYPYYFPMEALRGDSGKIEGDIASVLFAQEESRGEYHGD